MKTIKNILYFTALSLAFLLFNACESIDDFEPLYTLPAETGISDEASAELALTGAYAGFRQRSGGLGLPDLFVVPSKLSGLGLNTFFNQTEAEQIGFVNNQPLTNEKTTLGMYTRMYDLINRTNWIIEKVPSLGIDTFNNPTRKTEIVGEAKILRALAHFYLLRLYGQFYDVTSKYGLDVRTSAVRSNEAFPRKSVADTYKQIISDLDDGISNAPNLRKRYYTNKTFAKALKSKVLLYQGKFKEAAMLSNEILTNNGVFKMTANYASQFNNTSETAIFDNTGVLFGTKGEPNASIGIGNFWGFDTGVNPAYLTFASTKTINVNNQIINFDRGRVASQFLSLGPIWGVENFKYTSSLTNPKDKYEMIYHLRMAEVYLIFAEANARANNTVTTAALNALNTVRIRAGATSTGGNGFETYPANISLDQFLEAVRIEKYIELGGEQGEEWFDLIRYDYIDGFGSGFKVSDVKPTATNSDKFILPIPTTSIKAGGNVVEQNPSY